MGAETTLATASLRRPAARDAVARHHRRSFRVDHTMALLLLPLVAFLALALLGPLLPLPATHQDLLNRLAPPVGLGGTWAHPLGTDGLGRDLLARTATAARTSLIIGITATLLTAVAGVVLGLIAGVIGGWPERVVLAFVDAQLAMPFVVVGIAMAATLGQSIATVLVTLIVTGWVSYTRIVRLQARALTTAPFIEAAIAAGAGQGRLLFRHVLPNIWPAIIIIASQMVAAMIIYEASLSYLGLGLPPRYISLGGLVRDGQTQIFQAWWASAVPGLALALAVFAFNLLGEEVQRRWRKDD